MTIFMSNNSQKYFLEISETITRTLFASWIFFSGCELVKIGFVSNYFNPHVLLAGGMAMMVINWLFLGRHRKKRIACHPEESSGTTKSLS